MKFLIKNANVVFENDIKKKDILIENGVISTIKDCLNLSLCKKIDADGLFCMPGLVDLHVHLRDPGFLEKESVKTGAKAAAKGGFTSIACMANTNPVIDSPDSLKLLKEKISKEEINIYPIAAITKNLSGLELVDFKKLANLKVAGFSDDGFFVRNSSIMKKALQIAKELNLPVFSHCEDLNLNTSDPASEAVAVARDLALSLSTNCPVHICHVSAYESVQLIRAAKKIGVLVTAQTCPHYFMLTEEKTKTKNPNFKMNPPLRKEKDRLEIENGLLDGTLDCIATDHAPHEKEKKKDYDTALNGVIGLETALACTLTNFYHTKKMNLQKIVKLCSTNPAQILKIKAGKIFQGALADVILVNLNKKWTVKEENIISKSKNSPFIDQTLIGQVMYTFCNGKLIYQKTP